MIIKNFITDIEKNILFDWILEEFKQNAIPLLPNAKKCYHNCYCKQNIVEPKVKDFFNIRDKIIDKFSLSDFPVATPLGHFIMIMDDGASLGKHRDSGNKHFRCNIVIQKPTSGDIYIEGEKQNLEETDMCCFFPSKQLHWSDVLVGRRMTCSYGFFVPPEWEISCG